jgi:RNA polymerase sigma-70 factor (ECF subfamily)
MSLTSLQGLTQTEAATRAGISISGMKSRVQRGREQLRQMLVRCCEIELDVRGGVSDFQARAAGACGHPQHGAIPDRGCGSGACGSAGARKRASTKADRRLQQ